MTEPEGQGKSSIAPTFSKRAIMMESLQIINSLLYLTVPYIFFKDSSCYVLIRQVSSEHKSFIFY